MNASHDPRFIVQRQKFIEAHTLALKNGDIRPLDQKGVPLDEYCDAECAGTIGNIREQGMHPDFFFMVAGASVGMEYNIKQWIRANPDKVKEIMESTE